MVDRKIKLELDTSILRKEIAKTEAISDSDGDPFRLHVFFNDPRI